MRQTRLSEEIHHSPSGWPSSVRKKEKQLHEVSFIVRSEALKLSKILVGTVAPQNNKDACAVFRINAGWFHILLFNTLDASFWATVWFVYRAMSRALSVFKAFFFFLAGCQCAVVS